MSAPQIFNARDHLANERTFLAWIRTSISIIVFGFVVAKFGITLREFLSLQNRAVEQGGISLQIGVGFILMGILMALSAMIRYQINMHRINANQFKPTSTFVIILGAVTALFGAILSIYLIGTTESV